MDKRDGMIGVVALLVGGLGIKLIKERRYRNYLVNKFGDRNAESFSSKLARYGDGKRVIHKKTQNKGVMKVTERTVMWGGINFGIKTSYEVYYDKGTHYYTDNFTTLIRNFTPLDDEKDLHTHMDEDIEAYSDDKPEHMTTDDLNELYSPAFHPDDTTDDRYYFQAESYDHVATMQELVAWLKENNLEPSDIEGFTPDGEVILKPLIQRAKYKEQQKKINKDRKAKIKAWKKKNNYDMRKNLPRPVRQRMLKESFAADSSLIHDYEGQINALEIARRQVYDALSNYQRIVEEWFIQSGTSKRYFKIITLLTAEISKAKESQRLTLGIPPTENKKPFIVYGEYKNGQRIKLGESATARGAKRIVKNKENAGILNFDKYESYGYENSNNYYFNEGAYNAESHAYSYAYNEGHSDSRKREEYRPNLTSARQEGDFKKILKQKGD